jgi:hypothetical protein
LNQLTKNFVIPPAVFRFRLFASIHASAWRASAMMSSTGYSDCQRATWSARKCHVGPSLPTIGKVKAIAEVSIAGSFSWGRMTRR